MGDPEDERIVDKRAASRMNEESPEPGTGAVGSGRNAEEDNIDSTSFQEGDANADVATLREQADTYFKNWQRSAADFINFKRRVEQERGEHARLASAALIINLLPVFDDLDRAVGTVDAHLAGLNWVQGIVAIHKKFTALLEAMAVTEVPAEGQQFDPMRHEAVGKQPGPAERVLYVVQKGYQLGEKVIRPAMVIVGDGGDAGDS